MYFMRIEKLDERIQELKEENRQEGFCFFFFLAVLRASVGEIQALGYLTGNKTTPFSLSPQIQKNLRP